LTKWLNLAVITRIIEVEKYLKELKMKSPFTGKEMSIRKEWRSMNFRKDEFKVLFHSYICVETGEQFEDDAFAQLNYNQLVNQYRENDIP
jgi:hypothetical protein